MEGELIPIKITRVSSNDDWPLIYLPAEARRAGLERGARVIIYLDPRDNSLVVRRLKAP